MFPHLFTTVSELARLAQISLDKKAPERRQRRVCVARLRNGGNAIGAFVERSNATAGRAVADEKKKRRAREACRVSRFLKANETKLIRQGSCERLVCRLSRRIRATARTNCSVTV